MTFDYEVASAERRKPMRFGANTFIWRSPFSTAHDLDLITNLKEMGFDLIEVAVEDPELIDNRIGIETCVRLKREWVVRVVQGTTVPPDYL